MKKIYLIVMIFLFIPQIWAQNNKYLSFTNQTTKTNTDRQNPTQVSRTIKESGNRIKVSYEFSGAYVSKQEREDQGSWNYLHIKNFNKMGLPGKPALPVHNDIFTVGENCTVKITNAKYIEYANYNIHPALEPERDTEGAKASEFILDKEVYEKNAFFPEKIVEIASIQKYRGNPFATVKIQPVQFNPVTKVLRVYSVIEYELINSSSNTLKNLENNSTNILERSTLNPQKKNQRDDVTSSTYHNPYYIIIARQDYIESAQKLANWKAQLGYEVEVKTQEKWTSPQVKAYIHDRYQKMANKPEYFVIIGDHEQVPAETLIRTDNSGNHPYASDLYYACMDGEEDYTPDMGHGRISVKSPQQAMIVINKIINYEKNPVDDASFYQNGLNCAQFQDVQDGEPADGYAARRFCHTSEEIRDYITDRGYDVTRIYYTDSKNNPTNWNNGYYSNAEAIPSELLRENGFAWDGGAPDIKREINEGKFYVFHRDHGYAGGTGWAHPEFLTSDVKQLSNGNKLPVVFSMNCHTGEFMLPECFAEAFLRQENGGAVGVIGAAYYSLSGYNDGLSIGMVDAMWSDPGFRPNFGSGGIASPQNIPGHASFTYNMGDVLNQGLIRMRETWDGAESSILYTHRLFHYFGDPAMRIWTKKPGQITASFSNSLDAGTTSLQIDDISVQNVLITLVQGDKILASHQTDGANTSASLSFAEINNEKPVFLTISKHNSTPLCQQIEINGDTHLPVSKFIVKELTSEIIQYADQKIQVQLFDQSTYGPTSWKWEFSPATVSFVEGTSEDSQNPIVTFNEEGEYSISLTVANANGQNKSTGLIRILNVQPIACKPVTKATKDYNIGIHLFELEDIYNRTGSSLTDSPDGYMDFSTTHTTKLEYGREYDFSVLLDYGEYADPENLKMFIDYNNNQTFEDSELIFQCEGKVETVKGSFALPKNIPEESLGKILRLRLITDYIDYKITDGCYSPIYGQVEDYGIEIIKSIPVISLNQINEVTFEGAKVTSQINTNGGNAVNEYGILISENQNPEEANSTKLISTNLAEGIFSKTLIGLEEAKTYYVKAFATNDEGIAYSSVGKFKTYGPEPISHPTDFNVLASASSLIQLGWKDATEEPHPWGYLIKLSTSSFDDIAIPTDGNVEENSALCKNVKQGVENVIFENLTANTRYFVKIFPYSNSDTSIDYKTDGGVLQLEASTSPFGIYWASSYSSTFNLSSVEFNTIDNSTTRESVERSYYNFTDQSTELKPDFTYELKVNADPGGSYLFNCKAWFDWNHNGLFDETEGYDLGSIVGAANFTKEIHIPSDATHGKTTLRIIYAYGGQSSSPIPAPDPYDPHYSKFGSTEDYSVIVDPNAKIRGYWDGSESTAWDNPLNWDSESIPTSEDKIIIPSNLSNYPVINTNGTGAAITLKDGATLSVNEGANLAIANQISVNENTYLHVNGGQVSASTLEVFGRFDLSQGEVSLENIYTEIGSIVNINDGILTTNIWARSASSSWSKGTIGFHNGELNIKGDCNFSGSSTSVTVDGPININVDGSFKSGSNWDVSDGTLRMKATSGEVFLVANTGGQVQVLNNLILENPEANYYLNRKEAGDEGGLHVKGNLTINGSAFSDINGICNTEFTVDGNLTINENSQLKAGTNPIKVKGNIIIEGEVSNQSTLHLAGESKQKLNAKLLSNLTIENTQGIDLTSDVQIKGILDIKDGIFNVGDHHLELQNSARIHEVENYSNARMIALSENGSVRKAFEGANPDLFCFPVGDTNGSIDYTPVKLDLNYTDERSKIISLKMASTKVDENETNYINRHWILEDQANDDNLMANVEVTFVNTDLIGSKESMMGVIENNGNFISATISANENKIVFNDLSELGKIYTLGNLLVAKAGDNQFVNEGETIALKGSAILSPEVRNITYHWTCPDEITLSDCNISNPTFVAPVGTKNCEYEFVLTVSSKDITSEPSKVKVMVNHTNLAPVANAGEDFEIEEGNEVSLNASASSDWEDTELTYTWTAPEGIILSDIHAVNPTFTAPDVDADMELVFNLVVSDGELESETVSVTVKILMVSPITSITGISDEDLQIKVYPNPVKDIFYVKLDQNTSNEAKITIMDMNGKVVSSTISSKKTIPFQLNLNSGIYIIRIQSGEKVKIQKLVVQ